MASLKSYKGYLVLSVWISVILTSCTNGGEEAQRQQRQVQIQQQIVELTDEFRADMELLLDHYFELKDALVESDAEESSAKAKILGEFSDNLNPSGITPETANIWATYQGQISSEAGNLAKRSDVDEQRIYFETISETMIELADTFRPAGYEIYHQSCPMVRGESADWLSREEPIANPYHGERMLHCGEVVRKI
ncbi:MAG: DUF3347 domain-containing protein [Balneolaceae bacterium]